MVRVVRKYIAVAKINIATRDDIGHYLISFQYLTQTRNKWNLLEYYILASYTAHRHITKLNTGGYSDAIKHEVKLVIYISFDIRYTGWFIIVKNCTRTARLD